MVLNKTQIIRSNVPTNIHKDVKMWAYENKAEGRTNDTEKKVYAEVIMLGHKAYAEQRKKIKSIR